MKEFKIDIKVVSESDQNFIGDKNYWGEKLFRYLSIWMVGVKDVSVINSTCMVNFKIRKKNEWIL